MMQVCDVCSDSQEDGAFPFSVLVITSCRFLEQDYNLLLLILHI